MRNSPLKGLVRKGNSQGLNPKALKDKRERDQEYMMGPYKKKKAENQRIGQRSDSDIHHKPDGTTVRMSAKNNRNVWKHNNRT
jgi:hypothetical protein|tara:strand:+ start:676 stop:924 length:249 start_codon:yes stop_codon:yes gene_type:complete